MKYLELNAREKKAFKNIKYAAEQNIWGLVNTALDDKDSVNWVLELFNDEDKVVELVYKEATTSLYDDGFTCWDKATVTRELRDINFCGKEWLMERTRARVRKLLKEAKAEVENL